MKNCHFFISIKVIKAHKTAISTSIQPKKANRKSEDDHKRSLTILSTKKLH